MNRADRRRAARAHAKQPVLIAGEGILAMPIAQQYEARRFAKLPDKTEGKHRWMAVGSWVLNDDQARDAHDPDVKKFLDHENLFDIGIGCWDCEQTILEAGHDSRCPAPAADS